MRNLDFKTLLVALVIFGLGFATCFVVFGAPAVTAEEPSGEITLDRLFVRDYIEFLDNGVRLVPTGSGRTLEIRGAVIIPGALTAYGGINSTSYVSGHYLMIDGSTIIVDNVRKLQNVSIVGNTVTSDGVLIENLNAGLLGSHPASDFVLKSEIDDFCKAFLPLVLKTP